MTEQKKDFSKMCLSGFILSIMPLILLGIVFGLFRYMGPDCYEAVYMSLSLALALLPIVMFVLSLTGLGISIAGVVSAARQGKKGKGFGITGIILPNLYAVAIFVLIGLLGYSIANKSDENKKKQERSDIYHMGSVGETVNAEYDVSQYRIPQGYDLYSPDITVSDSEFTAYTVRKLDTISKDSDFYVKGTYQTYTFLIIRRDRYDEWNKYEPVGYVNYYHEGNLVNYYTDGYAVMNYDVQWEVSAFFSCTLNMFKDPSDKYIIITNCGDNKVITEFFEIT